MRFALPIAVLSISIILSGCGIFEGLFRKDPLTKEQRTLVDQAVRECPGAKKVNGTMLFNLAQIIEGKEVGGLATRVATPNLGDAAVLTHLWQQRICVLTKLDPTLRDRQVNWRREVVEAAENWPVFDSATYTSQVAGLKKAQTDHLARIKENYKNPAVAGRVSFDVFDAAIPFEDFMRIEDINIGVVAGKDLAIQNKKIGGTTASVCLSKYEYSTSVRPALDQTRSAAMGVARGTMTDAQAIEMMVSTVYEVGAYRLHEAKAGSDKAAQPVSCAPTVPRTPEKKPTDDAKKNDKDVDEKKVDGKKLEGKTTGEKKGEEKKPLDETKPNEKKNQEKAGTPTGDTYNFFVPDQLKFVGLVHSQDRT